MWKAHSQLIMCPQQKKTKKILSSYTYLPSGFNFVLKVGDLARTTKKWVAGCIKGGEEICKINDGKDSP
jgi:hypothetical protein